MLGTTRSKNGFGRSFPKAIASALTAVALSVSTHPASADPPLLDAEHFRVNSYTTGYQQSGAACSDANGNFVVVWQDGNGNDGQDGESGGIRAQRYDSNRTPLGTEFQINAYTTYGQREPEIACAANGDFVVVWTSGAYGDGPDGYGEGIAARQFSSSGAPAGTEFVVNTYSTYYQRQPDVCAGTDGRFAVVWSGQDYGIFARAFASDGTPQGAEFQIDSTSPGYYNYNPAIACDQSGNFVVVWGTEDNDGDVVGLRFDDTGSPIGTQFQVNTYTTNRQGTHYSYLRSPLAVSSTPTGEFVVVWESDGQFGYYGGTHIFGQRFDNAANPQGAEFRISENQGFYSYDQIEPSVAIDERGAFVVVWANYSQTVRGRSFHATGEPESEDPFTVVSPGFYGYLYNPKIAEGRNGRFVVSWTHYSDSLAFDDDFAVRAQRIGSSLCSGAPTPGCRISEPGKSKVQIKNAGPFSDKSSFKWKLAKGEETPLAAIGDPVTGSSRYQICTYDESGNVQPIMSVAVGPNSGAPLCDPSFDGCWAKAGTTGVKFKSKRGFASQGVTQIAAKSGPAGKAKAQVKAKGFTFQPPALPLTGSVTVQVFVDAGATVECWSSTFAVSDKNTPEQYKAKGP